MRISTNGKVFLILAAVILSLTACSSPDTSKETAKKLDDGRLSESVRAQTKICVEAQYNHDAKKWVDCIHPKILEAQPGGRDKMLKDLQETYALVGTQIPYDSMNFELPKEVKTLGKFKAAVVTYQVKDKDFDDKPRTSKDFLIGVSEDEGKTWKFANSSSESITLLDKIVPGVKSLETSQSGDEAVKKIIADLLNNCKSGDYDATFKQLAKLRMKDEKEFSYDLDKNFIQGRCKKYNEKFGDGYDFVNFQNKDGYLEWEVFPRNGMESSQIFSFVVEDGEYKYSSDYALKK